MALPLFAVTLFVSAFLLFLVQPMIGKLILPKLGGTPQVWNTCMLFFQLALLAGYAYTHFVSTRLPTRKQLVMHGTLLIIPMLILLPPIGPFDVADWTPDPSASAVLQALVKLAIIVGIPFFVVSTSAPLLQKWFVTTGHPAAKDPYFLYGASNLGSLLSLVFYPFLMEPWLLLQTQTWTWVVLYVVLLALVVTCIVVVWQSPQSHALPVPDLPPVGDEPIPAPPQEAPAPPPPPPQPKPQVSTAVKTGPAPARGTGIQRKKGLKGGGRLAPAPAAAAAHARTPAIAISRPVDMPVTTFRRIKWVMLAAVPSSLMLGITTYISTDLSPFPLIWAVPLALYLLSFILVYLKWPMPWTVSEGSTTTPHTVVMYFLQPLMIVGLCWLVLSRGFDPMYMFVAWIAFFCTALACHGELARDRPNPKHLTEYFLLMSVGGALGGFFNAIVAPVAFAGITEFYITLVLAAFVRPILIETGWFDNFVMNTFPNTRSWAVDQSDQLSRSFGKEPDGSTYVLSYTLDVLLGFFVLCLCWFLRQQSEWGWFNPDRAFKWLSVLSGSERTGALHWDKMYHAVIWGVPLVFCFFFSPRPVRFGLAVTAVLVFNMWIAGGREDASLYQTRTYFGVLRVFQGEESLLYAPKGADRMAIKDAEEFENFAFNPKDKEKDKDKRKPQVEYKFTYLMHGTTYHGRNYIYVEGEDNVDLSRLATTYYHRYGPAGVVMEKFNWLPGPQNTYWGDLRMPTTMIGQAATALGGALPYSNLANVWSEPPYATIGLGTGTMASYARPYQHMTYYEIDEQIREFSLPSHGRYYFTYLRGAMKRGANLEVIMGDARQSMKNEDPAHGIFPHFLTDMRLGIAEGESENPKLMPSTIGKMLVKNETTGLMQEKSPRERYYKAINVDAFSSDAIPIHLCTLEAIDLYLHKMAPDGVLMMHTSNRHMNLILPIAKIVDELNEKYKDPKYKDDPLYKMPIKCKVGKDFPLEPPNARPGAERSRFLGQFSSEYVMIYHDEEYLKPPKNYTNKWSIFEEDDNGKNARSNVSWTVPRRMSDSPWTDDYSNIVGVVRWPPWIRSIFRMRGVDEE